VAEGADRWCFAIVVLERAGRLALPPAACCDPYKDSPLAEQPHATPNGIAAVGAA
jgi:hypothetical protein